MEKQPVPTQNTIMHILLPSPSQQLMSSKQSHIVLVHPVLPSCVSWFTLSFRHACAGSPCPSVMRVLVHTVLPSYISWFTLSFRHACPGSPCPSVIRVLVPLSFRHACPACVSVVHPCPVQCIVVNYNITVAVVSSETTPEDTYARSSLYLTRFNKITN